MMIRRLLAFALLATTIAACGAPTPTVAPAPTVPPAPTVSPAPTLAPTLAEPTATAPAALLAREQLSARTDELLKTMTKNALFTGYVMVAQGDEILFSGGYGYSDRDAKTLHTATTRYRIGPVTMAFTAAAILLLEAEGKLRVEDPVCMHLPRCPAAWQPITIHHLLSYTAPIPDYLELPGYRQTQATPVTPDELLARFADLPLKGTLGELVFVHSGYIVLGRVIEHVSGQPYDTFLSERFFEPHGLLSTSYDLNPEGLATGYDAFAAKAAPVDESVRYAAGGLSSTPEDLLRWSRALYTGKAIPAVQLQKMITPHAIHPGGEPRLGYGVAIWNVLGRRVIVQPNYDYGFSASLEYYIDDDVTIMVIANQGNLEPGLIADEIAGFIFGGS
jgi:CubicO group peptidase (beta-lactamase class C family)